MGKFVDLRLKKSENNRVGIWRLAFGRMTQKIDFHTTIVRSFFFAGAATIATAPFFYFLIFEASPEKRFTIPNLYSLWGMQLIPLFIGCLLSAITGFALGRRYRLPGFGKWRQFVHDLPVLTAIGIVLMIISYVFFDRYFYQISPNSYPSNFFFIALMPLGGALAEELILRFGLVTIGVGICKNRLAGVFPAAAFAAILSFKYLKFMGVPIDFSYFVIGQMAYTFLVNCILGILFVSRGLIFSMTVKFIIGLKFLVVAWLL